MNGDTNMDRFRSRAAAPARTGTGDEGHMHDVLKRLGMVEAAVADVGAQVRAIAAVLPHLATKADVLATKADMHLMEVSLIKWLIGTTIGTAALAFAIAKFVS